MSCKTHHPARSLSTPPLNPSRPRRLFRPASFRARRPPLTRRAGRCPTGCPTPSGRRPPASWPTAPPPTPDPPRAPHPPPPPPSSGAHADTRSLARSQRRAAACRSEAKKRAAAPRDPDRSKPSKLWSQDALDSRDYGSRTGPVQSRHRDRQAGLSMGPAGQTCVAFVAPSPGGGRRFS